MKINTTLTQYKGFFFDLDGTLVDSHLDFDAMRRDLDFPEGALILEHLETLPASQQEEAKKIIHEHELKGAHSSIIIPGAKDLIDYIHKQNCYSAIQTRNSLECTQIMLKKHNLKIDTIITRENFKPKPHPEGLLYLQKKFNLQKSECVYFGDYLFDEQTARNANMDFILIKTNQNFTSSDYAKAISENYLSFFTN